jgi:single-strand DNA-binding protein
VLWSSLAQLAAKYLKKGSMVYLEGKLKYRSYEDKAGVPWYVTEVVGESMIMLDKKEGAAPVEASPG